MQAVSVLRNCTVVWVAYQGEDKIVPPDFDNLQDSKVMGSLSKHACLRLPLAPDAIASTTARASNWLGLPSYGLSGAHLCLGEVV